MAGSFVDTNVLIYLASGATDKADRAEAVLAEGVTVSVQVLNELANVARRKMRMSWPDLHTFLSAIRGLADVRPITIETHKRGLVLAERFGLSTYDAMIVASALEAGCQRLWSEDMQSGLIVENTLQIVNPFRS